jgi:hypothetical protein
MQDEGEEQGGDPDDVGDIPALLGGGKNLMEALMQQESSGTGINFYEYTIHDLAQVIPLLSSPLLCHTRTQSQTHRTQTCTWEWVHTDTPSHPHTYFQLIMNDADHDVQYGALVHLRRRLTRTSKPPIAEALAV